uniref:CSON010488 protein n=1 Tax=Culicoides sonorensis TaxID=179676 RepID=A0A336LFN8_CULSO
MKKLIIQVCFNQFIVGIIFGTVTYPILLIRGSPELREIPTFSVFVTEFYSCWLIREVLFYYLHRLSHHRLLYKHIHKKHHRWTAPIALSAEFCTPWEHILTNIIPTILGPFVISSHYLTIFVWFVHVMLSTLQKHSGYDIPWYYDSIRHNYHHENFTTNYGLIGLMDWLHGTNGKFKKPVQLKLTH